jgi:threonine synthase
MMKFFSTRNPKGPFLSFREAIFQGLAPDGGLYVPKGDLDLKEAFLSLNKGTSFKDAAMVMAKGILSDELNDDQIESLVEQAFPFAPKLVEVEKGIYVLELFHGPSCAFKDFGASFLATSMEIFLQGKNKKAIILTATSGDTGSAVAQAFFGKENIDVVILYPSGRVSPLQEKQLTTLGGNVHALEVKGSFDDCQKMVKEAFTDKELMAKLPLTSANSINLGRLLPQSFYYIWAFSQLKENLVDDLVFCVPSGNFGNLTAGIYAWKWGLPVDTFIAATNANDVVPEYLSSGDYSTRPSVSTYSNAMDVGNPSNFERMMSIFRESWDLTKSMIIGQKISDQETIDTMKAVKEENNYLLCPHTAVGYLAARRYLSKHENENEKVVVLATAHPGKFVEVVQQATGESPQLPPALSSLMDKEKLATLINNNLQDLKDYLSNRF